ncbi:MAG: hypothetical protein ABWX84_03865 [Nocardioides sp.]
MSPVVSVVFVPMSPLLFGHLGGAADPLAGLRSAAVDAVRSAVVDATAVVVLVPVAGREAPAAWWDPSGVVPGGPPLGTQVGGHLLELAGCTLPAAYVEVPARDVRAQLRATDSTALVVLGDGSAARRDGAPGYIDERSFAYDDAVAAALAAGDADALAALDPDLGTELLATGRLTWPVAAAAFRPQTAELTWRGDPFGLTYLVALWR